MSLRVVRERLEQRISETMSPVEADLDSFTKGKSPRPLPIVEYYDIEFRSFVNEMRRVLSKISELFGVHDGGKFRRRFEQCPVVSVNEVSSWLALMLAGDQRWIKLWIDVRVALEHPTKSKYVETLNFSLEKDRKVRLPTWRFIHPEHDMARPQNLLEVFEIAIKSVTFFENLQIVLSDGHLPSNFKVAYTDLAESARNPEAPMRYSFRLAIL